MSLAQIREELHKRIDLADERLLRMVYDVMTEADMEEEEEEEEDDPELVAVIAKHAEEIQWNRLTQEELLAELEESQQQIRNGEYISIEDLEQEMEQW